MDILEKQKELNKIFRENGVILAYLFGSAAKGKMGTMSDLDFAVLFSENISKEDYFDKELKIAGEIGDLFKIDKVDVINLKTLNNPVLKHSAVFSGKAIYEKGSGVRFGLEKRTMQEFEDTKYLRQVQYEITRKQIKDGTFGKPPISPYSQYLKKYAAR